MVSVSQLTKYGLATSFLITFPYKEIGFSCGIVIPFHVFTVVCSTLIFNICAWDLGSEKLQLSLFRTKLYGKPKALMLDVLFMVNQVHSLINAFLFKMGSFIQLWFCYFSYFWKFDCVSFSMHIQKLRLSLSVFQDFLPVLSFLASYLKRCFTDCLLLMYICNFFMLL